MSKIATWCFGLYLIVTTSSRGVASNRTDHSVFYSGPSEIYEGYPFSITCTLSRNDHPSWTIDGVEIPPNNDGGYILSQRVIDSFHLEMILHCDFAQPHQEGEYRCNGYSRDFHRLDVIRADLDDDDDEDKDDDYKGEEKKPDVHSSDQMLEINSTIKLYCTPAKDDDTPVHWYKNGRRISSQSESNIEITRKYIVIDDAQDDDAGEYMCTVDFPFQTGLVDIGRIFQIKSPAKILDFPNRMNVAKGRSMTLECSYHGFPVPKITWYKDNILMSHLMEDNSRIWVYASSDGEQKAYLTIRDISDTDKGMYTCRAENAVNGATFESDEDSAFVHVRENMIETNEEEPGMGKLLVPGEDLVLQCNTTECPQCRVVWYKVGEPLVNIEGHLSIYDENNSIVIQHATYDDFGTYMCAIDREQLDIALNATIDVHSETKLEKFESSSDIVRQGHPLELYCLAKGAPKPTIKWFKGNEEISKSHKRIKLLDHDGLINSKLMIEEADYEDRDHYTCEAYNLVNSVNTTIFIRVKDRLAALWPFLGICIEVAILCSIIFVYERRKNCQNNEADTDLPNENRNTRDQKMGGQDLRQRK